MPPKEPSCSTAVKDGTASVAGADDNDRHGLQYLYIIRHGDRWDYENKEWSKTAKRPGDPPLSGLGLQQARETGVFLDHLLADSGITLNHVTWLSSPFLRTVQTSHAALDVMTTSVPPNGTTNSSFFIQPEYSVFEWDGQNGAWHQDLPPLHERVHYFPRLNVHHDSLFIPTLPEPRSEFHARCRRAVTCLNERYLYNTDGASSSVSSSSSNDDATQHKTKAPMVVTHAATCIGLVQAATGCTWQDITPAGPCSVYRLTRRSTGTATANGAEAAWMLEDPPDTGLNGHTDHLSDLGTNTVPWNNFGDKKDNKGYTGPPNSRFAPLPKEEQ